VFLGLVTQRPAKIDSTTISQCSTLFVMGLSNDRDQVLIRSAVSNATANLLSFIPSLGTAEVFAFGAGVTLPTRMRFKEVPPHLREAGGNARLAEGMNADRNLIASVVDRWRAATMTKSNALDDDTGELGSWRDDTATAQSSPPGGPTSFEPQQAGAESTRGGSEPQRPSILRKPISPDVAAPQGTQTPTRWR
jgi:uncharacterized protein